MPVDLLELCRATSDDHDRKGIKWADARLKRSVIGHKYRMAASHGRLDDDVTVFEGEVVQMPSEASISAVR